jgi:hypothetical protein
MTADSLQKQSQAGFSGTIVSVAVIPAPKDRRRESRGERRVLGRWIPACAGMTGERKATVSPYAIALPGARTRG